VEISRHLIFCGPYPRTDARIDEYVDRKAPGVFVLGEESDGNFHSSCVGRSHDDINARLKEPPSDPYAEFKFCYAKSPREAFEIECEVFHNMSSESEHPHRPINSGWRCPRCHIFG
jgi:hypothetical protein